MTAPVNPEGQTAQEPKTEWRVIGAEGERTAAICTPDGDEVAEVYGNAAHLETAYRRAVEICAAHNAGQTPQEVRRAVNDGRQSAYVHVLALVASCLRAAEDEDRALASTPSPAKQTEQKIASVEGAASPSGAAPATPFRWTDLEVQRLQRALQLGCEAMAAAGEVAEPFRAATAGDAALALAEAALAAQSAPAQPDARDAEIARLTKECASRRAGQEQQTLLYEALLASDADIRAALTAAGAPEGDSFAGRIRELAARLTKELEEARAQELLDGQDLVNLRQQVEDCIGNAQTDADGDGWITAYHFNTGSIHRLLAMARDIRPHQGRVFRTVGPPAIAPPEPKAETPAETAGQKEGPKPATCSATVDFDPLEMCEPIECGNPMPCALHPAQPSQDVAGSQPSASRDAPKEKT